MQGRTIHATALMLAVAIGLTLLVGCSGKSQNAEDPAVTAKRQALIQQHKADQGQ